MDFSLSQPVATFLAPISGGALALDGVYLAQRTQLILDNRKDVRALRDARSQRVREAYASFLYLSLAPRASAQFILGESTRITLSYEQLGNQKLETSLEAWQRAQAAIRLDTINTKISINVSPLIDELIHWYNIYTVIVARYHADKSPQVGSQIRESLQRITDIIIRIEDAAGVHLREIEQSAARLR